MRRGAARAVLDVHGTGDPTIPYGGDAKRQLPAVRTQVAAWALRNGCVGAPVARRLAADVTSYRWRRCRAATEHVAVTGGGHVWPGADVYSGPGHTTHGIEASRVIWRFFAAARPVRGGAR